MNGPGRRAALRRDVASGPRDAAWAVSDPCIMLMTGVPFHFDGEATRIEYRIAGREGLQSDLLVLRGPEGTTSVSVAALEHAIDLGRIKVHIEVDARQIGGRGAIDPDLPASVSGRDVIRRRTVLIRDMDAGPRAFRRSPDIPAGMPVPSPVRASGPGSATGRTRSAWDDRHHAIHHAVLTCLDGGYPSVSGAHRALCSEWMPGWSRPPSCSTFLRRVRAMQAHARAASGSRWS